MERGACRSPIPVRPHTAKEGRAITPIDNLSHISTFVLVMATLSTVTHCSTSAAPPNIAESCVDKKPETGEVITSAIVLNEISSYDEESTPLPLEVAVPKEHLPDVLDVYDKDAWVLLRPTIFSVYSAFDKDAALRISASDPARMAEYRNWEKFLACNPVRFVRKYPVCITHEGEEVAGDTLKASATSDCRTIGQLEFGGFGKQRLGSGFHSNVFLALFTLLSCAVSSLHGEVAVKLAKGHWADREMLENEAEVYNKFPCELQESTPSSPGVVPKFFGYYSPSCESVDSYKGDDGDEGGAKAVRRDVCKLLRSATSPILLLEHCGKSIKTNMPSNCQWDTILGMFDRLHNARFIQRSIHRRNILVQPGPLTHPLAERSLDNPSYRIIDFGRGGCYDGDESNPVAEEMRREQSMLLRQIDEVW
ncbi:hypothetical protein EDB86DRAFT_2323457 [Lactarius hatsudake]|nr:hypothetical protein EDB86DRAFT_2323457 [Lactarius hatsudake]